MPFWDSNTNTNTASGVNSTNDIMWYTYLGRSVYTGTDGDNPAVLLKVKGLSKENKAFI